ncbi:ADP-ribosylglycohydrolase-domain-containing protein [Halteromyces radiatus]|uniref:ADP-ribosylglycohydrolase-domain-containing protein n=1 Tax=Halteromyces radiatus TaxID=101107 RepID=UPI00221E77F5|nr:ADP-ribosylglycohydrolase-domain-containing protein [Halteromyces radiatus]KAI8078781.1 ADP-ribosylglycohydrolase-domain-containing protein [Halteromyces radiatus]
MRIPSGCSKHEKSIIVDRVKGLIFGAIIGDSLGLATEGMTKQQISQTYGDGPIQFGMEESEGIPFLRDSYRSSFDDNDFGGDSEQQLLLIQSIIQNHAFNYKEYAKLLQDYSQHGLQGLQKKPIGINKTSQIVIAHPEFLINPRKAAVEVWQTTNNLRGASGALVRAALLGIPKFWDGTTVIENTTDCCKITHPDPRCIISCVIISTLVARILRGQDLETDDNENNHNNKKNNNRLGTTDSLTLPPTPTDTHKMTDGKERRRVMDDEVVMNHQINVTPPPSSPSSSCYTSSSFPGYLETDTTLMKIVRSVIETNKGILTAPNSDPLFMTPETDATQTQLYYQQLVETCSYFEDGPLDFSFLQLDSMIQGSLKCLHASLYSFTRHLPAGQETDSFKRILMDLVMQGGEADTNATVTGALLGVRLGYSNLPSEWVVGLKRWEWLEDRVEDFCSLL